MVPFCITKEVPTNAFGLDLPPGWQIHLVFHMSKLKHHIHSEDFLCEIEHLSLVLVGHTLDYEVEGIIRQLFLHSLIVFLLHLCFTDGLSRTSIVRIIECLELLLSNHGIILDRVLLFLVVQEDKSAWNRYLVLWKEVSTHRGGLWALIPRS